MLRASPWRLALVNGFAEGSRGHKHVSLAPTLFKYRFQFGKAPTPYISKYLHTLGEEPTGLAVPFRLKEFEETYLKEHVPADVEEWLAAFIRSPVDTIALNTGAAVAAIEACAAAPPTLHRRAISAEGILGAVQPVQAALADAGIDVPAVAVRLAMERPALRARLADCLMEWGDAVRESGSTPHRRFAARQALMGAGYDADAIGAGEAELVNTSAALLGAGALNDPDTRTVPAKSPDQDSEATSATSVAQPPAATAAAVAPQEHLSPEGERLVQSAMLLQAETAYDERVALEAATTLAEAAQRAARYDVAERLLRDGLRLAHDEPTEGIARANYASALNGCGRYAEAEAEARESVLLCRRPTAFANWAVAVAYQDDWERAAEIIEDGLAEHPDSEALQAASASISKAMVGRTSLPEHARGRRVHSPTMMREGVDTGDGKFWGHFAADRREGGRVVKANMSTSEAGLGQWNRRTGPNMGGLTPLMSNRESY
jgi:tetratricopeptide (TPR) repeat protein